jgi:hypothetical protein
MVPNEVSTEAAVFTEPLAAALEIQEQIAVAPTDRVLVVGDGKLGLLVAQSLAPTGCELLVIGRHRAKLEILAARGIRTGLVADAEPVAFDVAVECTGNAEGFEIARAALRPRGTLVMKSTYAGRLTVDPSALVVDEITLVGSRCGPFEPALRMLRDGGVDVMPLVHARYPLEEGVAAFDPFGGGGERDDLLPNILDGDPATEWRTEGYHDPLPLLKPGVGIAFTVSGSPSRIQLVDLSEGTQFEIYWSDTLFAQLDGWTRIAGVTAAPGGSVIDLPVRKDGFWLVWFTDLPLEADGSYRARLTEVRFLP